MNKRYLIALLALILLSSIPAITFAGSWNGWIYQNPYPTSNTLLAVKFVTPKKGWVAGEQGAILYTEDGGNTWAYQESGTVKTIKSIFLVNERQGWAVGGETQTKEKGVIIHTDDSGKSWAQQQGDFNSPLNSVFFLNDREGWIAGDQGKLLHTTDGGKKWEGQNVPIIRNIASVCFLNPKTGWLLAGDEIYRTTDGGKKWDITKLDITLPINMGMGGRGEPIPDNWSQGEIYFLDAKKGWAVTGFWPIFFTEDGGKTWTSRFPVKAMSYSLRHISFSDDKRGCASGSNIICTEDGGNTWKERLSARPLKINDFLIELQGISFADQSIGWTVGESGQIMKTEDAGKTWTMTTKRDECGRNTFFLNKKTGWIYGPYGDQDHFKYSTYICRTDDGGLTREIQNVGIEVGDVFFVDNSNGWAVGWLKEAQGVQNPGGGCPCPGKVWNVIKHTGDGGKTWKIQFKEVISDDLFNNGLWSVYFVNSSTGWAVGYKGIILHTKDGGKKWQYQNKKEDPELMLQGIWFVDSKEGWIIGTKMANTWTGIILHTTDSGAHWQTQYKYVKHDVGLDNILFSDRKSGWVTGVTESDYVWLLHTTDAGRTWQEKELGNVGFSYIAFLDNNRGILYPEKEWLLLTSDGGKTWTKVRKPLREHPWHFSEIFEKTKSDK